MVKNLWKYAVIAVLLALLLVLAPSPVSTYDAFAEIVELDMKGVGMPINWDNYTSDTHYEDPSLTVDIVWGGRIYDTNYVYALVKIANGTQIRTAMAGDQYSGEYTAIGSTIGKSKNAVFAINGDYFKHSDHQNGFMVRQGKTYRNRPSKMWDLLMIDQYGDFHTIVEPDKDKLAAWRIVKRAGLEIINTFNFGPLLILDGQVTLERFQRNPEPPLYRHPQGSPAHGRVPAGQADLPVRHQRGSRGQGQQGPDHGSVCPVPPGDRRAADRLHHPGGL